MTTLYEIGIVIPVYRSTVSVLELLTRAKLVYPRENMHVFLVDDSGDKAIFSYLSENCLLTCVTLIRLDKNYGQQNAILCGLRYAAKMCKWVSVMDDDLQHPPELLPVMLDKAKEGHDLVYAIAQNNNRSVLRSLGSQLRDKFFTSTFDLPRGIKVSSYRLMSQELACHVTEAEVSFFYLSAVCLADRPRVANVFFTAVQRSEGKSGYSLWKLLRLYLKLRHYYNGAQQPHWVKKLPPLYHVAAIMEGKES